MQTYHPFGWRGKPDTCLWCGRKLRFRTVIATDADKDKPTYKEHSPTYATVQADKRGPNQDGLFDTDGCGYLFGQRLAQLGHRLVVPGE